MPSFSCTLPVMGQNNTRPITWINMAELCFLLLPRPFALVKLPLVVVCYVPVQSKGHVTLNTLLTKEFS